MKKLRVAVVGCGSIAIHRHIPEYASRKDVEIVALVDPNTKRAKELAKQYGVPDVMKDIDEALKLGINAVSICTPNYLHAPQTIKALKAGAHVLCEKPMAASVAEAKAMIRTAKAKHRQLMIAHNQRLAPSHVKGKEIYQSGVLGKCVAFSTNFHHQGPESWSADGAKGFFFKRKQAIIGALGDLGVHKLDMMRWFLEDEFVQVTAMAGTLAKEKCTVEDTAFAVLRTEKGALGQMFAGWINPVTCDNDTQIYCERGIIKLNDDPEFTVIVEEKNGNQAFYKTQAMQTNDEGGQTASGVIDEFVNAIRDRRKNTIPGEEGARSLAAVLACLESSKTGRATKPAKI